MYIDRVILGNAHFTEGKTEVQEKGKISKSERLFMAGLKWGTRSPDMYAKALCYSAVFPKSAAQKKKKKNEVENKIEGC